jgi:hypothetical protein
VNQIRVTRASVNRLFALSCILFLGLRCDNEYSLEHPFLIIGSGDVIPECTRDFELLSFQKERWVGAVGIEHDPIFLSPAI